MIYRNKKMKTDMETENNIKLMWFALEFIDNLGNKFVHLFPRNVEKCKQIIFPDGFWVDDDKNIHTCSISPIYRYRNKKSDNYCRIPRMVRVERIELSSQVWKTCILTVVLHSQILQSILFQSHSLVKRQKTKD